MSPELKHLYEGFCWAKDCPKCTSACQGYKKIEELEKENRNQKAIFHGRHKLP